MRINHDFSQFDPTKEYTEKWYPPKGDYKLALLGAKEGTSQGQTPFFLVTCEFAIAEGELRNKTFTVDYLLGHSTPKVVEIAKDNLAKVYYGATGNNPSATGFDLSLAYGKPFAAHFDTTAKARNDDSGKFNYYPSLSQISPLTTGVAPQQAIAAPAPTVSAVPLAWNKQ